MGYYSAFEGNIEVVINDVLDDYDKFVRDSMGEFGCYVGSIFKDCNDTINLSMNTSTKGYDWIYDIQKFVDTCKKRKYVVNGGIVRLGEEAGDFQKLVIKDNIVKVYSGKIVFDDGSEYTR